LCGHGATVARFKADLLRLKSLMYSYFWLTVNKPQVNVALARWVSL